MVESVPMPGLPEIEQIRKLEDEEIELSKKYLGDTYTLAHDITALYDLLRQLISNSHTPPKDEIVCGFIFLLSCRYHLTISCLTILRGHLTDASQSTRRSMECCAFADRIFREPELGVEWLNATDEDESYKLYRRKFSTSKIFPKDDPVMQDLRRDYDNSSKQIHPSLYSFARRLGIVNLENLFSVGMQYFEITPDDPGEPARTFLFTIVIHLKILKKFSELFREEIEQGKTKWDIHYNAVEGKYALHLNRWKDKMFISQAEN